MGEIQPTPENEIGTKTFTVQVGFGGEGSETFTVEEKLSPDGQTFIASITRNSKTYEGNAPINEPRGTALVNAINLLNDAEKGTWTVKWDY